MKRPTLLQTSLLLAAFALGTTVPLLIGAADSTAHEQAQARSEVPSLSAPPPVPASMTFAGQTFDLRRSDHRERLDRELMTFTYMHTTTMLSLKRANRYFPLIEPILRECGVPDDFKYLAVIESSLNPLAKSPAGAAGLWQFMPASGREHGLEVNLNIDERYHIEKETRAACRYLKEAYARYGNWLSVAAAYNAGKARITTQLEKQQVEQATDLWLVEETSRYMFRLLAAKAVFTHPLRYGFRLRREHLYPPIPYTEHTVTTGIASLPRFARTHGLTYAQLREANPWLRDLSLANKSGRTYVLKLPRPDALHYDPSQTPVHYAAWIAE